MDDDTLRSEPFLHAYFSTFRAAESTRQRDKIRCLARLLSSSTDGAIGYGDDYEEMLGILTETTYLELQTLARLAVLEEQTPHAWLNPGGKETDVARAFRVWPAFLAGFGDWSHDRIGAHLTRLRPGHPNDLWCADDKGEFMLADRRYCYPLKGDAAQST